MKEKAVDKKALILKAEKELAKRQLQLSAPRFRGYFILMLVVVLLNYIVDMFASNINNIVYSDALFSILNITSRDVNDAVYLEGNARFEDFHLLIQGLALVGLPLYKSLADKYGRKKFLWLNSLLTATGMFIMLNASSVIGYVVGYVVISFFFNGDVHQLYLIEESPKKYRSTIGSIVSALGSLAAASLGVFRKFLVTEETMVDGWRNIMFVCVIFAVPVVLLSIVSLKDTKVFLENRIEYLTNYIKELNGEEVKPKVSKEEVKEDKKIEKGGFINSIKFIFKHKQTGAILIVTAILATAMVYQKHYSTILNDCVNAGTMTNDDVSYIAMLYPIIQGVFGIPFGYLADKAGRKLSFIINIIISIAAFPLFIFGTRLGLNPILCGVFYGCCAGGYWTARSSLQFNIMSESTPTNMRATTVSFLGITATASYGAFNWILSKVAKAVGSIPYTYLAGFVIMSVLALLIFIFFVHETKDADLDLVTGAEFD